MILTPSMSNGSERDPGFFTLHDDAPPQTLTHIDKRTGKPTTPEQLHKAWMKMSEHDLVDMIHDFAVGRRDRASAREVTTEILQMRIDLVSESVLQMYAYLFMDTGNEYRTAIDALEDLEAHYGSDIRPETTAAFDRVLADLEKRDAETQKK